MSKIKKVIIAAILAVLAIGTAHAMTQEDALPKANNTLESASDTVFAYSDETSGDFFFEGTNNTDDAPSEESSVSGPTEEPDTLNPVGSTPSSTYDKVEEMTDTDIERGTETASEETTVKVTEKPAETTAVHVHLFGPATCIEPAKCTCGVTDGYAAGHNWNDATYTSPKNCTICGATDGSPLTIPGGTNYHGHVYTGGEYSKKYHYEERCAGKNSHEITWDEVQSRSLGPCGTCVLK